LPGFVIEGIGCLRGRFHDFNIDGPMAGCEPVTLVLTCHAAYLLRNPQDKGEAWADLQQVMAPLGLERRRQRRSSPASSLARASRGADTGRE
jgi:hypothetical protein